MNNEDIVIRIKLRELEECVVHQYNIYEKYGNNRYGNQSVGKSGSVSFSIVEDLTVNPFAEIDPITRKIRICTTWYADPDPPNNDNEEYYQQLNQQPLFPVDTNTPKGRFKI